MRSIGCLRRQRRIVDNVAKAAIDRQRTGKHHPRHPSARPAGLEDVTRAIQIDLVAQIEIGLGAAADHGSKMENRIHAIVDQPPRHCGVADVGADQLDARVFGWRLGRFESIDQGQMLERLFLARGSHQFVGGQQA